MAKQTHDDLFEGTTMSFGEHLEELRVYLFRALAGLVVTCTIGFFVADKVVAFFQLPLERAMKNYYKSRAEKDLIKKMEVEALPVELQNMIYGEEMVPDPVKVETGRLLATLRAMFPDQLGSFHLSEYGFMPDDLFPGEEAALCRKLVTGGEATQASPAKRVWQLLAGTQQKQVALLANVPKFSSDQQIELTAILNSVIAQRKLHESEEFQSLEGVDKATVDVLRANLKKKFDTEESRHLNKLLLIKEFSGSLLPPRVNLIPLFTWKPIKVRFQVLNAQEAFMIWMKAAIVFGLVLGSPWALLQIWNFVAAGLYPHEKSYVFMYLPISLGLFLAGASIAYLFVFDPVLNFLFMFNDTLNADFDPRIGEWLSFVLILPLGFGIGFQLPLVMLFLNRIGIVSVETYIQQWRIAILSIFVIAMVLTPADPYSMLLMAVPLCLLYVVGIYMCKWMPQGRNPFAEAYEP